MYCNICSVPLKDTEQNHLACIKCNEKRNDRVWRSKIVFAIHEMFVNNQDHFFFSNKVPMNVLKDELSNHFSPLKPGNCKTYKALIEFYPLVQRPGFKNRYISEKLLKVTISE